MSALSAALAEARAGRGGAAFVVGEAGVGKSRLAREVETLARLDGVQVWRGRAVEGSTGGYRPVAEALLSTLRTSDPRDASGIATLSSRDDLKPFRPILGRLIPEWRPETLQTDLRPQASGTDDAAVLLGEAILRLLRAVGAGRGSLLLLEDLHWADADTLAVVEYLTDNLRTEPVLLLGTIRSDEPGAAMTQVRGLAARRLGTVLDLPRLDPESVEMMARICLEVEACPEPVIDLLAAYTEGLPFLVEELLAAWIGSDALVQSPGGWEVAADLPPVTPLTFAGTVNRRLARLGNETRRMLKVAAVLGRHFDWRLLPRATGLAEEEVLEGLRHAIELQLVADPTASGDSSLRREPNAEMTFRFRHALTRAAVLAQLLPPERAALAARLLSLVEEVNSGLPGEWCNLAARLAEEAGKRSRAGQLLLESGRRALARGALATAESNLEHARELSADDKALSIEIEEALIEALSLAGKGERVFEVGKRLLAEMEASNARADGRSEVFLRMGRAALAAGGWDEAADYIERARQLGTGAPGTELPARLDALAAQLAIERGRLEEATAFARAALDAAEEAVLPDVACEALEALGRCARVRDLDEAEAAFKRARSIAEENTLTLWQIRALHELGTLDIFRGARVDRLSEARDLAMKAGALATAAMVDVQLAACYDMRVDTVATLEVARRAETMARRLRLDLTAALALSFQAQAYAKVGNRTAMEAAIAGSLHLAESDRTLVASMWEARAFASAVDDNWQQALQALDMAVAAVEGMPATTPGPFYGLWAMLRSAHDVDGSAACEAVRRVGATINPLNRAFAGYGEAILLGRAGRRQEAVAAVSRADAELDGMDWYRHCARRVVAEAAIADGWGDPATWLWEACACFESRGQGRLVSACKSLLRRAGVPAPRTGRSRAGVPAAFRSLGITRREMEVLSVVAEGLSNREIGERLYLSPRTVEKHVASLLAKTDTRTRAQLAALAVSVGTPS